MHKQPINANQVFVASYTGLSQCCYKRNKSFKTSNSRSTLKSVRFINYILD